MKHFFGRLESPDPRDHRFLLDRLLHAPGTVTLPKRKLWTIDPTNLNQGSTGSCVGHAWANFLRSEPIVTPNEDADAPRWAIYDAATQIDQWPENDADTERQHGTSVRAAAQALKDMGRLKSYVWAFSLQPAIEWVLTKGPLVMGTNWYESMNETDAKGLVKLRRWTRPIGGHAYLWRGVDTRAALALCSNSWGDSWGRSGDFDVSLRDMERLIREGGECCAAVQQVVILKRSNHEAKTVVDIIAHLCVVGKHLVRHAADHRNLADSGVHFCEIPRSLRLRALLRYGGRRVGVAGFLDVTDGGGIGVGRRDDAGQCQRLLVECDDAGKLFNAGMSGSNTMRAVRGVEQTAEDFVEQPSFKGIIKNNFDEVSFREIPGEIRELRNLKRSIAADPIGGVPPDHHPSHEELMNMRRDMMTEDEFSDWQMGPGDEEMVPRKAEFQLFNASDEFNKESGMPHYGLDAFIPYMGQLPPIERGKIINRQKELLFEELDALKPPYVVTNNNSMSTNSYPLSFKMLSEYIQKRGFKEDQTKVLFHHGNEEQAMYGLNDMGIAGKLEGIDLAKKYVNTLSRISDVRGEEMLDNVPVYDFMRLYGLTGAGLGMSSLNER